MDSGEKFILGVVAVVLLAGMVTGDWTAVMSIAAITVSLATLLQRERG